MFCETAWSFSLFINLVPYPFTYSEVVMARKTISANFYVGKGLKTQPPKMTGFFPATFFIIIIASCTRSMTSRTMYGLGIRGSYFAMIFFRSIRWRIDSIVLHLSTKLMQLLIISDNFELNFTFSLLKFNMLVTFRGS